MDRVNLVLVRSAASINDIYVQEFLNIWCRIGGLLFFSYTIKCVNDYFVICCRFRFIVYEIKMIIFNIVLLLVPWVAIYGETTLRERLLQYLFRLCA